MAASSIVVQGFGLFPNTGINRLPTLGFFAESAIPPGTPGIELTLQDCRPHFMLKNQKLHFTSGDNRLHFVAREE